MKSFLKYLFFILIGLQSVLAQRNLTPAQSAVKDQLDKLKSSFESSTNDTVFVKENSDRKQYFRNTITRGDQADDLEVEIFGAAPGKVVGPFEGDNNFYLLKILTYENQECIKARQYTFIPKNEMVTDTAKFRRLVEDYAKDLCKGKEVSKKALKDSESLAIKGKPLGTYWAENKDKIFHKQLFDRKKSDPLIFRSNGNLEVVIVTDEKSSKPYKAKVVTVMKNVR